MIKTIKTLVVLAIAGICFGCSKNATYLNEKVYSRLQNICAGAKDANLLVYYFDGDCALCLAKANAIEHYAVKNPDNLKPIFIAKTMNPQSLQFNVNKLNLSSCVYVEKNREFEKDLNFMKVTKIAPDRSEINFDNIIGIN